MKKQILARCAVPQLLIYTLIACVFLACFSPMSGDSRYGTIVFGGGDTSRAVVPGTTELPDMKYRITMEGPGGTVDSGLLAGNGSGVNYTAKVLPGSWNILVKAYNVENTLRAHSRFTVTVSGGDTAAPTYTLTPIVGVKSWAELKDALAGGNSANLDIPLDTLVEDGDTIYITADLEAYSQSITPSSSFTNITLAAEGTVTIRRELTYTGEFFYVGTNHLTLGDSSGKLILDGMGLSGSAFFNIDGGVVTMKGDTILRNNIGNSGGGAVSITSGSFNMEGGTITGNSASSGGGGVYMNSSSLFNMSGGTISNNTGGNGKGVLLNGIFQMQGSARISADNDVYLTSGNYIYLAGPFSGGVGWISGPTSSNIVVVQGTSSYTLSPGDMGKFTVESFSLTHNNSGTGSFVTQ